MCNTAREIEAATQPLSHSLSTRVAGDNHSASQPLCQSGWGQPLSHSARVAGGSRSHLATEPRHSGPGAAPQPLCQLGGWGQPLSHLVN